MKLLIHCSQATHVLPHKAYSQDLIQSWLPYFWTDQRCVTWTLIHKQRGQGCGAFMVLCASKDFFRGHHEHSGLN